MPDAAVAGVEAITALETGTRPSHTLAYAGPGFADAALREHLRGQAVFLGADLQEAVTAALGLCAI